MMYLRLCLLLTLLPSTASAAIPKTGNGNAFVDDAVVAFMEEHEVPGLALALVRNGVLVMARGYGYADQDSTGQLEPTDRFRLASISKSITATAAMKLEESGHLSLQDPALATWLPDDLALAPVGRVADFEAITIGHLLSHTSGWDFRSMGRDLVFEQRAVAGYMGVASPARPETMIDYALKFEVLRHAVGDTFAYDNFNYMLAGRVLESVSGRDYEDFVRSRLLAPLGIRDMQIGGTRMSELGDDEVHYHTRGRDAVKVRSVYDTGPVQVPMQYGGWDHQSLDALGGWTASAVELARLLSALDGTPTSPDLLRASTIERMGAVPQVPAWDPGAQDYYAMGWERQNGSIYHHGGSLPGTTTMAAFEFGGNALVVLMNTREDDLGDLVSQALFPVFTQPEDWPDEDLFDAYGMNEFVVSDEISGAWFDPGHDGEGFIVEMLDSRSAVVYWFTYDEQGRQRWFIGIGDVYGGSIDIPHLLEISGGRFGSLPNEVAESVIGSLRLDYDSCNSGLANYVVNGVPGTQNLTRLTRIHGRDCPQAGTPIHLPASLAEVSSGNWYRPDDPGEGIIFQRLDETSAVVFWFTFDHEGKPAWMVGVGEAEGDHWNFSELEITSGGRFGEDFDPADVKRETWGSLTISAACLEASVDYASLLDNFSNESQQLSRLTWLAGEFCPIPN